MSWFRKADDLDYSVFFSSDGETDASHRAEECNTPDVSSTDGESNVSGKQPRSMPGGATTVTKKDMPFKEHPSTDMNDPMQPSSEPTRDFWFIEGPMVGVQESFAALEIRIHGPEVHAPGAWSFNKAASFGEFIDNVVPTLQKYRRCGMQRESAAASLNRLYSALFTTAPWITQLASRFLDQVYGTTKPAKCEASAVADSIAALVDESYLRGLPKAAAMEQVTEEFSAWLDNSPGTNLYLKACMDRRYGIKLGQDANIAADQKIQLLNNPDTVGVILETDETPTSFTAQVAWLTSNSTMPDVSTVDIANIGVLGKASPAELQAARNAAEGTSHTGQLLIYKSAGTYYMNLLIDHNPVLPLTYSAFREWCTTEGIGGELFLELERTALAMNFIQIPDGIPLEANNPIMYVSETDDTAKVYTVPSGQENLAPDRIEVAGEPPRKKAKPK